MEGKRCLIFIPFFTYGGAEKQAVFLAKAFKEGGFDVHVWGFPTSREKAGTIVEELSSKGIVCSELSRLPKLNWNFAERIYTPKGILGHFLYWIIPKYRFKKELPGKGFDIVIPFTFYPNLISALYKAQLGASLIFWNHRGGDEDGNVNYTSFLKKKIQNAKPVFVANSFAGTDFIKRQFGISPDKIFLVKNAYFSESSEEMRVRPEPQIGQKIELIQIANFYPEKDLHTLLDGLSILNQRHIPCHLHLVGAFLKDEDFREYQNKVNLLSLNDSITYHGELNRVEIFSLLQKCHIGILSSKSEGTPNSVMEYMYWKLAVIATDIPGIRELVGEELYSGLFTIGDAKKFADKIQWAYKNTNELKQMGIIGHKKIKEEYTPEIVYRKWMDLIANNLTN